MISLSFLRNFYKLYTLETMQNRAFLFRDPATPLKVGWLNLVTHLTNQWSRDQFIMFGHVGGFR